MSASCVIGCIPLARTNKFYSVGRHIPVTIMHYVIVFHLPASASEPSPMQQVTSTVLGLSVTLVTVVIMLVAVIVGTVSLIAYVTHLKKKQGRQNPPLYS